VPGFRTLGSRKQLPRVTRFRTRKEQNGIQCVETKRLPTPNQSFQRTLTRSGFGPLNSNVGQRQTCTGETNGHLNGLSRSDSPDEESSLVGVDSGRDGFGLGCDLGRACYIVRFLPGITFTDPLGDPAVFIPFAWCRVKFQRPCSDGSSRSNRRETPLVVSRNRRSVRPAVGDAFGSVCRRHIHSCLTIIPADPHPYGVRSAELRR